MAKETVNLCGINTQCSHILVVSTNKNNKIQNVMNQNCISTSAGASNGHENNLKSSHLLQHTSFGREGKRNT